MPPFIISLLASFLVEAARSAGKEAGIQLMAGLGPLVSKENAAKLYEGLVQKCQEYVAAHPLPPDLAGIETSDGVTFPIVEGWVTGAEAPPGGPDGGTSGG